MRKTSKMERRTRCALESCRKEPFKKNLAHLYKGLYFCNYNHRIKYFKELKEKK